MIHVSEPPALTYFNTLNEEQQQQLRDILHDLTSSRPRRDPNYAVFLIDNFLPDCFKSDILYAAVAAGYERRAARLTESNPEHTMTTQLASYFRTKCSYLNPPTEPGNE